MKPVSATLAVAALLLAGCAGTTQAPVDVLATFYPMTFLVERLGGANVTVGGLVPAGAEPHDWEPSPADVARLDAATLVVAQGAGFEPWLAGLVDGLGEDAPRVVETSLGLANLEGEEGVDPHTWLSPVKLGAQAAAAERALAQAFPDHAVAFRDRLDALRAELDALHAEYAAGLADCEKSVIVANHDAYAYLAVEYAFEVAAVSGLSPEAEPDPETVAAVVDLVREHNLTIVFFEESASPRVVEVIAKETGAESRVLSPAETGSGDDYLTLMRENLASLREAMRCR